MYRSGMPILKRMCRELAMCLCVWGIRFLRYKNVRIHGDGHVQNHLRASLRLGYNTKDSRDWKGSCALSGQK